jgi:16S rRNA processing protein RimM
MAEAPALPEGTYWLDDLVGRTVVDENGEVLGAVEDVAETGGGEVLVVGGLRGGEDEILIPLVREFVAGIEEGTGRVRVRIPDDLRDLNRDRSG